MAGMAAKSAAVRRERIEERLESGKQRCGKCGELLPLDRFSPSRGTPTGREYWCRPCRREYRRALYFARRQWELAFAGQPNLVGAVMLECCPGWRTAQPPVGPAAGRVIAHHDPACPARRLGVRPSRRDWVNGL
jgi:hypothetical protein